MIYKLILWKSIDKFLKWSLGFSKKVTNPVILGNTSTGNPPITK